MRAQRGSGWGWGKKLTNNTDLVLYQLLTNILPINTLCLHAIPCEGVRLTSIGAAGPFRSKCVG